MLYSDPTIFQERTHTRIILGQIYSDNIILGSHYFSGKDRYSDYFRTDILGLYYTRIPLFFQEREDTRKILGQIYSDYNILGPHFSSGKDRYLDYFRTDILGLFYTRIPLFFWKGQILGLF